MRPTIALVLAVFAGTAGAIELNTASQAQLEALPGLGVASTERMLAERARAPFRDWPDLLKRVKGLKHATARRGCRPPASPLPARAYAPSTGAAAPADGASATR